MKINQGSIFFKVRHFQCLRDIRDVASHVDLQNEIRYRMFLDSLDIYENQRNIIITSIINEMNEMYS